MLDMVFGDAQPATFTIVEGEEKMCRCDLVSFGLAYCCKPCFQDTFRVQTTGLHCGTSCSETFDHANPPPPSILGLP